MSKSKFLNIIFSPYVVGISLTVVIFVLRMAGPGFSLSIPWALYVHPYFDAIFTAVYVKSIIDGGSILTNAFLGFPGGYELYSYPIDEFLNLAMITVGTFFSKNYALVQNLFYFLTFVLTTLTSLYTTKKLGLNKCWALFVSILFTFAPYHFFSTTAAFIS